MPSILLHPHELVLKGLNRSRFLDRLVENVRDATRGKGIARIARVSGGLLLLLDAEADEKELLEILSRIPGIANLMLVYETAPTLEALKERMAEELASRKMTTFRITARRSDKTFPLDSLALQKELGAWVVEKTQAKVNLLEAETDIFVDVSRKRILFGFEKVQGQGGLPVGVSGNVLALLSGGFDSPVASWMMMRRGCHVAFAHFHSYPYVSRRSQEKAKKLAAELARFQGRSTLFLIPFGDVQREVLLSAPARYRVLLYRRFMMRIAARIAKSRSALALVTGENLGQVASQTLENIAAIENASPLPVFRPLIGMHKDEIIGYARRIGTYEISCMPDEDCCQLFMPSHPATRSHASDFETIEQKLPCEELIEQATAHTEKEEFSFRPKA